MKAKIRRSGDGYCATLEPLDGVTVGATADDAAAALHTAAKLLDGALDNPAVQAVLPPGTTAAVKLLRGATAAIRRGDLEGYMSRLPSSAASFARKTLRRLLPW